MHVGVVLSGRSSAEGVQQQVLGRLFRKNKSVYGARPNQEVWLVVDDLHLAGGTQVAEWLRSLLESRSLYESQR